MKCYIVVRKGIRLISAVICIPAHPTSKQHMIPFHLLTSAWLIVDLSNKKVLKSYDANLSYTNDHELENTPPISIEELAELL